MLPDDEDVARVLLSHYEVLKGFLVAYNAEHGTALCLATFKGCNGLNRQTGMYTVALRGVSEINYTRLSVALCAVYAGATIVADTNTMYMDNTYIVVPVTEEAIARCSPFAGALDGRDAPHRQSSLLARVLCCPCLPSVASFGVRAVYVVLLASVLAALVAPGDRRVAFTAEPVAWLQEGASLAAAYAANATHIAYRYSTSGGGAADATHERSTNEARRPSRSGGFTLPTPPAPPLPPADDESDSLLYTVFERVATTLYPDLSSSAERGAAPPPTDGEHNRYKYLHVHAAGAAADDDDSVAIDFDTAYE